MKTRRTAGLLLLGAALVGCGQSATQKLADTSYDVAMAERFGRLDIVSDQVAPATRAAFIESHADWGGDIRIVDLDYGGMRLNDERHADVMLTVSWQRFDEVTLRTTRLKQSWIHTKERWYIDEETEVGGDRGLLDVDPAMADEPKNGKRQASRTRGPHDRDPGARRGFDDPAPLSVD